MKEKESILKTLVLAGVEWELSETIHKDTKEQPNNAFIAPKAIAPIASNEIMEIAKRRAKGTDILAEIQCFSEHPLYSSAKNTVIPHLTENAKLMVITDTPSLNDDQTGQILSGTEGELFDKMMSAIGLGREQIAITPLVFWRPAGGRTPTADEIMFCKPLIDRIITELKPDKILTLGALAAKEIAGATLPKDHGKKFGNIVPIYKPDFILENPNVKKEVWSALQTIMN